MIQLKGGYMSNTIYYFTGTGNSLYSAKKIAENIGCNSLISIADAVKSNNLKCDTDLLSTTLTLNTWQSK